MRLSFPWKSCRIFCNFTPDLQKRREPDNGIGGAHDGLNMTVVEGLDAVRLLVSVTDRETYIRSTLTVGDASVAIYKHESMTPEQVLNRLVEHYKAWSVNMPGGRR
jgi:hypothetical protein